MFKKWIVLALTTLLILSACHSAVYNQTEANVADAKLKLNAVMRKSNASIKPQSPLTIRRGMYVDRTPINLDKTPGWLSNHIVIRGDTLPFSYYSRTIASGAGSNVLTTYQYGLDATAKVSLNYSGTIKGALDALGAKLGYVYSISRGSIFWQAFITRTFDIAFMPGSADYSMGKSGGGGATTAQGFGGGAGAAQVSNYTTGDTSDSEFSSLKGSLSLWKDLEATIKQILSPQGSVMVSESTTSVTVRDRPSNVDLVCQYIHNLNTSLSKQVLVKVQVLEVNLENSFEFGINWGIIERAFANSPFVLKGNFGTPVAITSLTPQPEGQTVPIFGTQAVGNKIPSYTILFNSLNQQGKTSVVSEPRVVCLNNQVSVIRITQSQGYLASVQNTSLAQSSGTTGIGTVTTQLTPGILTTGLTLYILPKILKDKIYLQVNADISIPLAFTTIGSNTGGVPNSSTSSSIQVPNVNAKSFNQRSVIKSGDTLILAGFRQLTNIANANQLLTSQALGGKGSTQTSIETVILITPIILHGSA